MALAARGRPAGSTDKPWRDALRIAANTPGPKGKRRLRVIAEKLVSLAEAGDVQAIREIGDRLDGKAVQAVAGDNDGGPVRHELVFRWEQSVAKS